MAYGPSTLRGFKVGDRVAFTRYRGPQSGEVLRVGRKYLMVKYATAAEREWAKRNGTQPRRVICYLGPHEVVKA